MTQEVAVESEDEGSNEVIQNSNKYEIDSIKRSNSKNSQEVEIVVAEKENATIEVGKIQSSNSNALIENKEPNLFDAEKFQIRVPFLNWQEF